MKKLIQNIEILSKNNIKAVLIAVFIFVITSVSVFAQSSSPQVIESKVRVVDSTTMISGQTPIHLWGVEEIGGATPAFKLRARTALANAIGSNSVQCEVKARRGAEIFAQCINKNDLDLGLFMLQQGYVTADRATVYGGVFEEVYIQAEIQAQDSGLGIWASTGEEKTKNGGSENTLMLGFSFILFICVLAAFAIISIIIMRGFQRVIDAQNFNAEMSAKERKIRKQERSIVASIVLSELKANKSKIEAYLVVYEEMLNSLKDPDTEPKYKRAGDIVQKQPSLDRSVFEKNADKLDVLGRDLASELIHFYARIKSNPDYENLEPEMELAEAVEIVSRAVQNGQRLNELAGRIMESFASRGVTSTDVED